MQVLDAQAGADEGAGDLGEAVLPAVGDEAGRVGVAVGVAALDGLHVGPVRRRQQPVLDLHVVLAGHLVEGVGERVDLGHVEGAAGLEVTGDDAAPSARGRAATRWRPS